MKPSIFLLNERDREAVWITVAFLQDRLTDQTVIDWAITRNSNELIKRVAILQILDHPGPNRITEPWRTAWRLIEESWESDQSTPFDDNIFLLRHRLTSGERSGALITAFVDWVRPVLKIGSPSEFSKRSSRRRARRIEDLLSASLSSHELPDLNVLEIDSINQIDFLVALGNGVEGAVNYGLDLGRRLGWESDHKFWRVGQLYYVGYRVQLEDGDGWDVDKFHKGIAPSVKLLDTVVKRISELDPAEARIFVGRWKTATSPIYLRLWASLSQDPRMTSGAEVGRTLASLGDRPFWDIHAYPEIAELKALRFSEIAQSYQDAILARIKRGPSRLFWNKDMDRERLQSAKQYWAAREVRRIEIAGNRLPRAISRWLAPLLQRFPDLEQMGSIQFGFLSSATARWVPREVDDRFNDLLGDELLRGLENALSSGSRTWNEDPSERAANWIRSGEHVNTVLLALDASPTPGDYANVWETFAWSHRSPSDLGEATPDTLRTANQVLELISRLPSSTIGQAIEGITHWFSSWEQVIAPIPRMFDVWMKIWPIAVDATNGSPEEISPSGEARVPVSDEESTDVDSLNTPVGKLVGVFLMCCPKIRDGDNPFITNRPLRAMRDAIVGAHGRAGVIGRYRLVEQLQYFREADEGWALANLIAPLAANDAQSLALWRAIARTTRFTKVLRAIGPQIPDRAVDRRLGREVRSSLLSSLVIESLHAFRQNRDSVVPNAKIMQTIRIVDDEVRANAAQTVQRFLSSIPNLKSEPQPQSAEQIFHSSVAPFLESVWPQERSLATKGVSAAFAEIPASAGRAFSEAVRAIERFLVPFDCWSLFDFGLKSLSDDVSELARIDTPEMASALLRLLDLSIGSIEGSVVPMDLTDALDQIRLVNIELARSPVFKRLEAAARRR